MVNDRQKILIVDDKQENLYALEKVLEKVDADIIRTTNGNDALIASLNHEFALAILDVQMPLMDGYELAGYLRDGEKTRNLPVIFLTAAYSDEYHEFKGYEAGAVDFVSKPYRPEILLAKVRIFQQLDRQRRELEKTIALEKQKNHLENILLSMTDAVMVVSKDGFIQTANEATLSLLSYAPGEIIDIPFSELFEDNILSPWKIAEEKTLSSTDIKNLAHHNIETRVFTKHKEAIPVIISGSAFHDRDNLLLGVVIVARDIREQIKSQKALEASEEKYRTLYETSRDGIAFCDMFNRPIDANRAFLDMVGYEKAELLELNCRQLIPDKWHDMDANIFKEQILPRGYADENEKEFIRKDGAIFPVSMRRWLSRDDAGNPIGMWILIRDITDIKILEQQRIMTEKMTALGMLAGGMSHELNNPLMGIHGFIEYCLNHTETQDKRHAILEDAKRETKQCMDLVENLLTFSHMGQSSEEKYRWVDCEDIFDRVLRLLAYRIEKEDVRVVKQISEESRKIYTKGNTMQQVFLNLMTNALDAVMAAPKREIRFEVRPSGENILITLSDTGNGILPGHMKRIFDPFFTTKPVGKGTGLGLSVSKSIVESHGGEIVYESTPGKGTRIGVRLPGKKD
ncbi:MAG: PAS domain S-box protein [Proteobacteria bacterium]|nr:PAS domain S-box protein [Pseudomonadota bacterium]